MANSTKSIRCLPIIVIVLAIFLSSCGESALPDLPEAEESTSVAPRNSANPYMGNPSTVTPGYPSTLTVRGVSTVNATIVWYSEDSSVQLVPNGITCQASSSTVGDKIVISEITYTNGYKTALVHKFIVEVQPWADIIYVHGPTYVTELFRYVEYYPGGYNGPYTWDNWPYAGKIVIEWQVEGGPYELHFDEFMPNAVIGFHAQGYYTVKLRQKKFENGQYVYTDWISSPDIYVSN